MEPETGVQTPAPPALDLSLASPPISDGPAPVGPPEPTPTQSEAPSETSAFTPEQIAAHIATLSHEDLKQFPAYNARMGTAIEQERTRLRKEAQEQQARQAKYAESDTFFKQYEADPAAFGRLMLAHPEYAEPYQEVLRWRKTGGVPPVDAAAVAKGIVDNVETHYRTDPRFAHMTDESWGDLRADGKTADDFIFGLIEAGIADERKQLIAKHKTELAAKEKEYQAKYAGGAEEPGTVPGSPSSPNGQPTLEQINKMTRMEREALDPRVKQAALNAALGVR